MSLDRRHSDRVIGLQDRPRAASNEHWTEYEADATAFKDARLGRRFGELLKQMGDGMGSSIPLACQDWSNTKAAYRFLSNARVDASDILIPAVTTIDRREPSRACRWMR
jgi:Transposase DNA-binding